MQEKLQVQHNWTLGLCGLAASTACTISVWAQDGGAQPPQEIPLPNPDHIAQTEQAIQQFRGANPGSNFLEMVGRITRVYGSSFGSGVSPHATAEQFRLNYAAMFGIPAEDLIPVAPFEGGNHVQPLMYENGVPKFTAVYYKQVHGGLTVFRSSLTLLTRNATDYPLVLASANLRDLGMFVVDQQALGNVNTPAGVAQAKALTLDGGVHMPRGSVFTPATAIIFAGVDDTPHTPVLALQFIGEGGDPAQNNYQRRLFITDAASGAVLYQESLVYQADVTGNVSGLVTDGVVADVCAPENPHIMPYLQVGINGGSAVFADANGNFTIPNAGTDPVTVLGTLSGRYFQVANQMSTTSSVTLSGVVPPGPANILHNAANASEFTRAEVNAYVAANVVRDLVLRYNPNYPSISTQSTFPLKVNINLNCNAFYSASTLNFYITGSGCNNTAFGSVCHHEYGHNVVEKGGSGQGAYGEGTGDCMAVLVSDSPLLGIGFQSCASALRNANNTCTYIPGTSCSSCGSEAHACGNLISGCIWSLRNQLLTTNPSTYRDLLGNLVVNGVLLHSGSSTIAPDIPVDYLALDDDNGDTNDGTPHWPEIYAAFNAHAMAPPALPVSFSYPNTLPAYVAPTGGTPVRVKIRPGTDTVSTATLNVDVGSGFTPVAMTLVAPDTYEGVIPASTCGKMVKYYFSATTAGALNENSPSAGAGAPLTAVSAASLGSTVFNDNFETDQGWGVATTATDGAWDRGVPVSGCSRGNPPTDADGSGQCYLTHNSAANACNSDVDGGSTTLTSPVMDVTGGQSVLQYWRWYSNTAGSAPNADTFIVEISSNGGASWQNLETVGPVAQSNGGWFQKTWSLGDIAGFALTNQFRVRFTASDLAAASVVEAAVDGVKVTRLVCSAVPGDITGDGHVDVNDLLAVISTWGPCPAPPSACPADIVPNGQVDVNDLLLVISHWG